MVRRSMVTSHQEKRMHRVYRLAGGVAGLVLMLGVGLSWGGPPNNDVTDAQGNTAGGTNALMNNTTGVDNTAFGYGALRFNTSGSHNNAFGVGALGNNMGGSVNNAFGQGALGSNLTGNGNSAF